MSTPDMQWINDIIDAFGIYRVTPWRAPAEAEVFELEGRLGAKLPEAYRYFLRHYGGASISSEDYRVVVPIAEKTSWGAITRPGVFYSPCTDHSYSLDEQIDTYRDRLPKGVIPISSDAGGNQICLDVFGETPGSVWFWDHEQRWFRPDIQEASEELDAAGIDSSTMSVHDVIRGWARVHAAELDRHPDYKGMYRIAPTFEDFLRALRPEPYA